MDQLNFTAFILQLFNHFGNEVGLRFCEAMVGSLSVANTAVWSPKLPFVDSIEFGSSAIHGRYNNGLRILPYTGIDWG
jgi:hypothetical protein